MSLVPPQPSPDLTASPHRLSPCQSTGSVEIRAPGSAKRLWSWLAPGGQWGLILMFCPWMFHVGAEVWRHGLALNLGPVAFGIARTQPPAGGDLM